MVGVCSAESAQTSPEFKCTFGVEFDGAVVVLESSGNSDDLTFGKICRTLADHAETLNGLVGNAGNGDGNGNVLELIAVRSVDFGDNTCESLLAVKSSVLGKLVSRDNGLYSRNIVIGDEQAARVEFNGALVVLDGS